MRLTEGTTRRGLEGKHAAFGAEFVATFHNKARALSFCLLG